MKNVKGETSYKISGIYCITNIITGKMYIGSSRCIYYRIMEHISHLKHNKHSSKYFQNSYNKYGEDAFVTCVIEICDANVKILREREKYWIDKFLPEYNIMQNPITWEPTIDTRRKISETLKRRYNLGEISPYNHPNKAISLSLFNFKEDLVGTFKSIKELRRNCKDLENASLANNLRKGIYFCKNYIVVPSTKSFDFCVNETIKNCNRIPILRILDGQVELCLQTDYPHSVFEIINKNKGKITKIRKRDELFLHLGFLKKLMPSINSVNCGKPLEIIELQNS